MIREVQSMAAVFPKNPDIDKLFSSTAVFQDPAEAMSKDGLDAIFDAVEELRARSLVDANILS
jgi:hypothetical protein